MLATVYDMLPLTERKIDSNGFLSAPAKLSRVGVQKYRAREVRGMDGQPVFNEVGPDEFIFLFRPSEEIMDSESIASFEDLPVTDGHPDPVRYPDGVTPENYKELAIGHVRDCKAGSDGFVHGRVLVRDAKGISNLFSGKDQLSLGYGFECEKKAGRTADGQQYHGIMRKVRGNHLAICHVARGGADCRVADQQTSEGTMPKVKIAIDGIDHLVDEESASLVRSLVGQRDAATAKLAEQQTAHANAVTKLTTDHAAELRAVREASIPRDQLGVIVVDHATLLDDARALCPKVVTKGLDASAIRRLVVADLSGRFPSVKAVGDAILAGQALDKADDNQLRMVSNAVIASARTAVQDEAKRNDRVARAMAHSGDSAVDKQAAGGTQASADDGDVKDMSEETFERNNFKPGAKPAGK